MTNTDKQEQIYRWVKASERLPETNWEGVVKWGDNYSAYAYFEEDGLFYKGCNYNRGSNLDSQPTEWLEPYTPLEDAGQRGEVLKEFDKAIRCLAAELHHDVWTDVYNRWDNLKTALKAQSSTPQGKEGWVRVNSLEWVVDEVANHFHGKHFYEDLHAEKERVYKNIVQVMENESIEGLSGTFDNE